MTRVGLVLSGKPGLSETFIRAKIAGLQQTADIDLVVFYGDRMRPSKNLLITLYFVIKALFFLPRIYRFLKGFDASFSQRRKLATAFFNLPILTCTVHLDYLHFAFGNLIHNRAHLGRTMGAKTSISLRGYDITYYPINHPGCYEGVWEHVDKIQYNSRDLYDWAKKWGAPESIPAVQIPAAVEDSFLNLKVKKVPTQPPIQMISVGRLHWKKGFDIAILAVKLLTEEGQQINYHIYGEGPEREKLQFLIHEANLVDSVHLHPSVPHENIKERLDEADIFLAPSFQEGCSNVCLEAQARGVFCVVSDAEGMNEVIKGGITGFITPKGRPDLLAEAIQRYLAYTVEERQSAAETAVQHVKSRFTREQQIQSWIAFFGD